MKQTVINFWMMETQSTNDYEDIQRPFYYLHVNSSCFLLTILNFASTLMLCCNHVVIHYYL